MSVSFQTGAEPIPGYRLLDRLGSGGFGEVWRCEAPGGIFKAAKVIHGDLRRTDTDAYRFAEQEMKSLKRVKTVRHPYLLALDRFDVIDGRPGSLAKRGYLVAPFATVDIDGFRQNMDEVAAFRFGSVRGSYAGQKGNDRNVGVIGVAVFAERGARQPWTEREIQRRETADPFPGRFAAPPIAR